MGGAKAGTMAGPCDPFNGTVSELENVGHVEHPRVDIHRADIGAADLCVGLYVDIADVGAQGPAVADRVIEAGMQSETPRVVEIERCTIIKGFVEKVGVVDARADKGRELTGIGEVVLQRQRGRQVLGVADATAIQFQIVLERPRSQSSIPRLSATKYSTVIVGLSAPSAPSFCPPSAEMLLPSSGSIQPRPRPSSIALPARVPGRRCCPSGRRGRGR